MFKFILSLSKLSIKIAHGLLLGYDWSLPHCLGLNFALDTWLHCDIERYWKHALNFFFLHFLLGASRDDFTLLMILYDGLCPHLGSDFAAVIRHVWLKLRLQISHVVACHCLFVVCEIQVSGLRLQLAPHFSRISAPWHSEFEVWTYHHTVVFVCAYPDWL